MNNYNCIVVLGPTASGKTRLACQLANALNGEIISADSRQVYRGLNIGTGKDLEEYVVNGKQIPYHLIDIIDAGEQFYLHQFTGKLKITFEDILSRHKLPIICGGTGLYLDALKKDFAFTQIKENETLRNELFALNKELLVDRLKSYPEEYTKHVDIHSKKRLIRGIEIAVYFSEKGTSLKKQELPYKPYYIGISPDLELRRKKISERLQKRIDAGLIDEVKDLLKTGITNERLELFGLEYKFVSHYLREVITKDELFTLLRTAIFQFAKRQITWFRKMEKEGVHINWIDTETDAQGLAKELRKIVTLG